MTHCERIEIIRDKIGRIGDVALGIDIAWLCLIAERQITELANIKKECETRQEVEFRLRAKLEEEQAQVRRLEKECDELRSFVERVANDGYCDHGSRMMFDAKGLIAKVTQ